jgi:16S rRNA (guanine(966)-N(2))-methyltransferase RsmD
MRITGGDLKGRRLKPFKWDGTKPSTDKTRQALINILGPDFGYSELSVLDCYAGTGIVSLEFLSRGAAHVTSVDRYSKCVDYMRDVKKDLGLSNWETKKSEVFRFLKETNLTFDLVFADPPYLDDQIDEFVDFIIEGNILSKNGIFVLEHVANRSFNRNELFKSKKYGDSMLSFYKKI